MALKKYSEGVSIMTPNIFKSEGLAPDIHKPAPYLPLLRYDSKMQNWKVISAGKAVAKDSLGYLIPAGLGYQFRLALAAAGVYNFGSSTTTLTRYTQYDVDNGVTNALGEDVVLGEPVIWSWFATNSIYVHGATMNLNTATVAASISAGLPLGMLQYDAIQNDGTGLGGTPFELAYTNYKPQDGVAILTSYYVELPVLADYTAYDAMPFKHTAAAIGTFTNATHGVQVDWNSNYIPWVKGTGAVDDLVGKVVKYETNTAYPKNLLDKVLTYPKNQSNWDATDKVAGSETGGLPEMATYAGLTTSTIKTVRIWMRF